MTLISLPATPIRVELGPTFLFAGGGSGGHLMPGLAVAHQIRASLPHSRIIFVGSGRAIESTVLAHSGFEHLSLPLEPSTSLRGNPVRFAYKNGKALQAAVRLLREKSPAAVIGLGGYASVPLVAAASMTGVRRILMEQNIVPGRATSWLSRTASLVCTSFEETAELLPRSVATQCTGNPVDQTVAALHAQSFGRSRTSILVLGGSQGARGVNQLALVAAERLRDRLAGWRIIHQTGSADVEMVRDRYQTLGIDAEVRAFFNDLPEHYRSAGFAVTRAGATSLAELACAAVPAICIPYPGAIRDHQTKNALHLAKYGAADVISERSETATGAITAAMERLLSDAAKRRKMAAAMAKLARPNASQRVCEAILDTAAARHAA
ncbi:undecaprenyldiphospho-muramoylpentapeptide beta-N-acetylglucosaminyltransferase [Stratiformator vulcanicus]|uniref:UDP-N-acetylglucosamine--N-acetylmuramyl-(pentapeptide) pyrophosphoryl-undecaprenol N-acetylglucosamine transferase n=1 Tax=Stratiformator vulcanicus TaxID=2527980 RepID=A0A517R280_9PLAN|nr:undecaprenyldiphospho-muramoylpentapeptide beta-N-acetylglucosaminyltransferase [Stratiformator vulcanicus]QDT37982.1 UDP-N-acetylglucosamine--N-acetylmuramyl-(pentapeptide) pyrophosphoryl-undecaprenol N-acetylglucosamine transferase MurG [Stratiformator vulcanicus]